MEIIINLIFLQKIMDNKQNKLSSYAFMKTSSVLLNKTFSKKKLRLFTQPISAEKSRFQQRTTERSFIINKQFLYFNKNYSGRLPRGVSNIKKMEKRILTINQSFDSQHRELKISQRQKKGIINHLKYELGQIVKTRDKNLKPAEKMMLQFERQLKKIKRNQTSNRFDGVKQSKDRFESYSISISHKNNIQAQDCTKFGDGIHVLCDAHGSNGKQVAKFVCQNIFDRCLQKKRQGKIDKKSIDEIFQSVRRELELSGVDIAFSGSTCLLLIILEKEILIANLGDSRAIIKKQHKVEILTNYHVPSSEPERQRISIVGGIVRQEEISKGKFSGPLKIWAPGKNSWGPGLAISRSFGHKAARRYGVISEPQINSFTIEYLQNIIVVGSKGLFEAFKKEEIFDLIKKKVMSEGQNRQGVCQSLAEQALKKMDQQIEDVSVILIFL